MGKNNGVLKTSAAYLKEAKCCKTDEQADIEELREDLSDLTAVVTARKGVAVGNTATDSATAAGTDYSQAQVQSIITELRATKTELRALKTSLKNAGLTA